MATGHRPLFHSHGTQGAQVRQKEVKEKERNGANPKSIKQAPLAIVRPSLSSSLRIIFEIVYRALHCLHSSLLRRFVVLVDGLALTMSISSPTPGTKDERERYRQQPPPPPSQ